MKFTVNNISFIVSDAAYNKHFMMSEVEECERFLGVNDYIIESTTDPDKIYEAVFAILEYIESTIIQTCRFTGAKRIVKIKSVTGNEIIEQKNDIIEPDIVIEFVEKYIRNPKDILKSMIFHCDTFDSLITKWHSFPTGIFAHDITIIFGSLVSDLITHSKVVMFQPHLANTDNYIRLWVYFIFLYMEKKYGRFVCQNYYADKYINHAFDIVDIIVELENRMVTKPDKAQLYRKINSFVDVF